MLEVDPERNAEHTLGLDLSREDELVYLGMGDPEAHDPVSASTERLEAGIELRDAGRSGAPVQVRRPEPVRRVEPPWSRCFSKWLMRNTDCRSVNGAYRAGAILKPRRRAEDAICTAFFSITQPSRSLRVKRRLCSGYLAVRLPISSRAVNLAAGENMPRMVIPVLICVERLDSE